MADVAHNDLGFLAHYGDARSPANDYHIRHYAEPARTRLDRDPERGVSTLGTVKLFQGKAPQQ